PHHAIWDDHDYGPNNSNTSYEMREVALESFKQYWGNKTYGEVGNSGTYGKFTHVDAEFFLLDGRYHRAANRMDKDNPDKAYLGKRQMEWLKSGLLSSTSTFKFVASGSQVLNPLNDHECFRTYEKEHTELLEFIKKHKIKGVVFLSGDRHHSVITKVEEEGFYPLYDITSSPLSSGAYKPRGKEAENPYFVKNTLYGSQNYLKVSISGERKARGMVISCYDAHSNEKQWEYAIEANDLQVPKKK
ncbi:MAG: alkaline phosphatase D family protein, partial [Chitinophagales bacterium]